METNEQTVDSGLIQFIKTVSFMQHEKESNTEFTVLFATIVDQVGAAAVAQCWTTCQNDRMPGAVHNTR